MISRRTVFPVQVLGTALALSILSPHAIRAQSPEPGWTVKVLATNVSTLSGGEALALDPATGDLFVKSLQDPLGSPVQLVKVSPTGDVAILATFQRPVQNSDYSGIAIDPLLGGIILTDEEFARSGTTIGRYDLYGWTLRTLFSIPWTTNPFSNGTGQQQYAPVPERPDTLYFWDSTRAAVYDLSRSTGSLRELLHLDTHTPDGLHRTASRNDVVIDRRSGMLLLTDGSSNTILEIDPQETAPVATTLFSDLPSRPSAIALNHVRDEIFVVIGRDALFVGPRAGGSLTPVATGFSLLGDITVSNVTAGCGLPVYAVDKSLDTVYVIARSGMDGPVDIRPSSQPNVINPDSRGVVPVALFGCQSFDVALIDPRTLRFGPGKASPWHRSGGHIEHVNADEHLDLLLHFRIRDAQISARNAAACVFGETYDGIPFVGCDAVQTTP